MFLTASLLLLLACNGGIILIEEVMFEDNWWQLSSKELCFNVHNPDDIVGDNQVLVYEEDTLSSLGGWEFEEPNVYIVNDDIRIKVSKSGECWNIKEEIFEDTACECLLDVSGFPNGNE